MDFFGKLLDTGDFPPRWDCGNWEPFHGWLHIVSDSLIFLAYSAIPVSLAVLLIRRRDFPFPMLIGLFSAFILFCGVGHLLEAVIFYEPVYRLAGVWKAGTAAVSLVTAFVLIRAMPAALTLPSVIRSTQDLERAVEREQALREELSAARDELERHTSKVTSRVWKLTAAFEAARAVACRWTVEDARIAWEVGFQEGAARAGLPASSRFEKWSDLLDEGTLETVCRRWRDGLERDAQVDIEVPVERARGWRILISATPEPRVEGMPRSMVGLFRFLPE